jgi:nitrate/nitrite transport system substrate-binding protein
MNQPISRRSFLQGLGVTSAIALSSCAINTSRNPSNLPEAALAVKPIIDPKTLEKPNLTIGFVPVNDCAPFAIAWEKGLFRKYELNVKLSREASWANSRDGIIFGRLDASPVVSGAITNARTGAEGAREAPLCGAMTIHRHGNAMTMDRAMWDFGLRPWQEYNGDLDRFGRDLRAYFEKIPLEQRVWAVVLSSSIYEYFVRYLISAVGINPDAEFRLLIIPPPKWSIICELEQCKPIWSLNPGIRELLRGMRELVLPLPREEKFGEAIPIAFWQ